MTGSSALSSLTRMSRLPFELLLALRYLRPKRTFVSVITLISVLGVTLGVAVLIIVISVMSGFDAQLRDKGGNNNWGEGLDAPPKPRKSSDLKKLFPNRPTAEVAAELGRPTEAVKKKASRMGLKKSSRYMKSLGRM